MPRQALSNVENSFVNGLITQATGLNFPEKACTDTDNCIFWETGEVTRRKGIDFEDSNQPMTVVRTDVAMTNFIWKNVANEANLIFLVVQVGSTLYFWDTISFANISLGLIPHTIDLTTHTPVGGGSPDKKQCQFANGHGVLFVYHPLLDPFYIEYDPSTGTFTDTEIDIEIRDFEAEDDGLDVNFRPVLSMAGISGKHHYNLLNQGWTDTNLNTWDAARSDLPSNSDVMFEFKNASNVFDTTTVDNVIAGNSPAPNGHFILNAFNQDRIDASNIAGLTTTTTGLQRVSTGAFFAGRVWYSGIDAQSFKGQIFFSQIIERFEQFGSCYQVNDPSSESLFDLLPSDGGVIDIADAGTIFKLVVAGSALLVFASNGVWSITGSSGIGFTANDNSISKIAEIPCISANSFVIVAGYPMWWNYDGIYTIQPDQTGAMSPKSITEKTIKSFYQAIPDEAKLYARGCYNNILKTVQWVYRDSAAVTVTDFFNFNRALTLNLNTGAFYPWSVEEADPRINGVFFVESVPETVELDTVVDGSGNTVVDGSGNTVIVYAKTGLIEARNVYITTADFSGTTKIVFSIQTDTAYEDWSSYTTGPVDYTSFFTTGYKLHGQSITFFQSNYVYVYAKNDVPGSFTFRGIWDYALNTGTNRWSAPQTITYSDTNYAYSERRLRVRGNGLVLQFRVDSITGQPFDLIGWSLFETKNSIP